MRTGEPNARHLSVARTSVGAFRPDAGITDAVPTSRQTTIARPATLKGIGIHSGSYSSITMRPAGADTGIVFRKFGPKREAIDIPASYCAASSASLCTELRDASANSVATVEHVLAAIYGLGVDNVLIEIDGPEVPIMDGSASAFVEAIDASGIRVLDEPRTFINVEKTVRVQNGQAWGELRPYSGLMMDVEIKFDAPAIGHQRLVHELSPGVFRSELSRARTFGFGRSVAALWARGRALGASLANTVAIQDEKVVNREGLRYPDEFVRHKMLDAVGDMALAGAPLRCAFRSSCGGHALNRAMLQALFADRDAYSIVAAPSVRVEPDRVTV
jgi:UDP-3-O-[3-hydroxymyristoyl] N-acetylglucosamine deacetylase